MNEIPEGATHKITMYSECDQYYKKSTGFFADYWCIYGNEWVESVWLENDDIDSYSDVVPILSSADSRPLSQAEALYAVRTKPVPVAATPLSIPMRCMDDQRFTHMIGALCFVGGGRE